MEYLKLLPGDLVILGRHKLINGKTYTDYWSDSMNKYVGTKATIVRHVMLCSYAAIPCYNVKEDITDCNWRISDMTILPNKRIGNNPYFWAKRLNQKLPEGMY